MAIGALRRVWWFPPTPALPRMALQDPGTYAAYDLDSQPAVAATDLRWLEGEPAVSAWPLDNDDASPQRQLRTAELADVLGGAQPPPALGTLAAEPAWQRKIRSSTGCYLDLGDKTVPTIGSGVLLHLLSDQQWARHWVVLLDPDGRTPVLSTGLPIGFDLPDDWYDDLEDDEEAERVPATVPLDGSVDLTVSADSIEEFLFRLWIENEIFFRTAEGVPLTDQQRSYAERLAR